MRRLTLENAVRTGALSFGALLVATAAAATPISYGVRTDTSYLTGDGASSTINPHDDKRAVGGTSSGSASTFSGSDNREFNITSSVNLGSGTLKVTNSGSGGASHPASASVTSGIAEFIDTFTVFGDFTSPVLVPFSATFDGSWTKSNVTFAGLFGQVWFGSSASLEDWSNPSGNPGGDLWAQPSLYKDFGSDGDGDVAFTLSGNIELTGVDPSFVAWLRMEAAVFSEDPDASWVGDFGSTGKLTFDFDGLDVASASGAFPGTRAINSVPEPGTTLLMGACLAGLAARARRGTRGLRVTTAFARRPSPAP